MRICGLKLTHDASVAVVADGTLLFSVEMEKLHNRERHADLSDAADIVTVLTAFGLAPDDIDAFVIDGWFDDGNGTGLVTLPLRSDAGTGSVQVSSYLPRGGTFVQSALEGRFRVGGKERKFHSYPHLLTHVVGTWCTSPFGQAGLGSYVLVWDGGTVPRLFDVDPIGARVAEVGVLHSLIGNVYSIFAQFYEPFRREPDQVRDDFSIPGKLMAYIALGHSDPGIVGDILAVYRDFEKQHQMMPQPTLKSTFDFSKTAYSRLAGSGAQDRDILASFHSAMQELLIQRLTRILDALPRPIRLCFTGGCALNIRWNSAIRRSGVADAFWVPPFPNDSGSAIGAACCHLFWTEGARGIDWNVYAGPELIASMPPAGWTRTACSIGDLADALHSGGAPIVFLTGRAELGPRSLGHRSILASPGSVSIKEALNRMKQREAYRPVAPICSEREAPKYFDPGTPDPFMLFEHQVRVDHAAELAGIRHLDGTARLQTVSPSEEPVLASLLEAFSERSGVPVLCNTSANHKGRGFFPGIADAAEWGGVDQIWSDDTMYYRSGQSGP